MRDVTAERRKIWTEAVKQAQRLAAVHDPSGARFNVDAVTTLEDGRIVTLLSIERRKERQAEKEAQEAAQGSLGAVESENSNGSVEIKARAPESILASEPPAPNHDGINADRRALMGLDSTAKTLSTTKTLSKTQQRKREKFVPIPPPPKPIIPEGIALPDGEENWLSLWHLSDEELERRVLREKRRKAAERKALRVKQQQGKVERRAARDEKRKAYREEKLTWKTIKGSYAPQS